MTIALFLILLAVLLWGFALALMFIEKSMDRTHSKHMARGHARSRKCLICTIRSINEGEQ